MTDYEKYMVLEESINKHAREICNVLNKFEFYSFTRDWLQEHTDAECIADGKQLWDCYTKQLFEQFGKAMCFGLAKMNSLTRCQDKIRENLEDVDSDDDFIGEDEA